MVTAAEVWHWFTTNKPKRMPAHLLWHMEKKGEDAAFTREVETRLLNDTDVALAEGKNPPPRAGVVNSVAAIHYKALTAEEQARVVAQVDAAHDTEVKAWLARRSAEPDSPRDAVE